MYCAKCKKESYGKSLNCLNCSSPLINKSSLSFFPTSNTILRDSVLHLLDVVSDIGESILDIVEDLND